MGLQPVNLRLQNAMSAIDGATIERRIRISQLTKERKIRKWIRAKIPLSACRNTRYLQRSAPSHLGKNAPSLQGIGHADMA